MTKELTELLAKADILENAGYYYKFDNEMYVNRRAKKAFSMDFIEDHAASEIERCILAPADGNAWQFYFNTDPSSSVRQQLELALG
ncbi:MAG TPA: hypothetical protein VG297_18345 [Bryobacteraceae bacterium]|jgi:hypothetical protein|nr:hypothetical protein [Bryobacteraceae bacterium]